MYYTHVAARKFVLIRSCRGAATTHPFHPRSPLFRVRSSSASTALEARSRRDPQAICGAANLDVAPDAQKTGEGATIPAGSRVFEKSWLSIGS